MSEHTANATQRTKATRSPQQIALRRGVSEHALKQIRLAALGWA